MRNAGATELLTSYTTGEGEPWPFYERLGFVPTGERATRERSSSASTSLAAEITLPASATHECRFAATKARAKSTLVWASVRE